MQQRIETLAELKAIRFDKKDTIFCKETKREYYFEADGGALTPDDLNYVQAVHDVDARFVAMDGSTSTGAPMSYKGVWDADTNTPALADGIGEAGWVRRVTVAGSQNLGSGSLDFEVDDRVIYNGATWEKWDANDAVQSVFGRTGPVVAQMGDYSLFYDKWPVGSKLDHFGATAPTGFLACDGAAVSRATYAALFAVVSTTYGVGDGSTTFNLPDARGLVAVGAGAHGSMTRADGSAYNGGSIGATRNDQYQSSQIGATVDRSGNAQTIYGQSWNKDASLSASANANFGEIQFTTTAQGIAAKLKDLSDGTNGTPRTGNETRPAEIAVLVCIKY